MQAKIRSLFRFTATALGALLVAGAAGPSDQPASPSSKPVLRLTNGRTIVGEIQPSTQPKVLRWQAASSGSPSDFAWNEVSAIEWPVLAKLPKPDGDFCFELAGGDILFGSLVALGGQSAELDVPRMGRIHVQRSNLYRVYRLREGAELLYLGPNGLAGWHEPAGQKNWREDSGRPTTDRDKASIRGDFGLPDRASIEFEISWTSTPAFAFALGVDETENSVKHAFRFEAWGNDLVIQRELKSEADLAVVQEFARGPGSVHLQVYFDQNQGRVLVFSAAGKPLAVLKMPDAKQTSFPGLYLANKGHDVRLERLRISRWNGEIPADLLGDQTCLHRADGSILCGQLIGMQPDSKELLFKAEKGASRIPVNQVAGLNFPVPKASAPRTVRAIYQDGSRVSGEVVHAEEGALVFAVPGLQKPVRLPWTGLRSLVNVCR